jgi:prolyl-tRNA synthetase
MVLSMTHEEVIADLVRKEIHSYRQLPQLLYHIQTKWRDDPRPRAGLIRAREFTMKDSYSLDADWEGLDKQYEAHHQAYQKIFQRCDLRVIAVKSDTGIMGGQIAHEFMYLTPIGEDTVLICDNCGYSANKQIARVKKIPYADEPQFAIEKVATPNSKTIEDLASYLSVPTYKTSKAVFIIATILMDNIKIDRFVIAIVRGDMEVNETKLANALNATEIRPAMESEIRAVGAVPGYASPVGLSDVLTVVDELIPSSPNLISGANIEGYHLRNVNFDRDYNANIITDITIAHDGEACVVCNHPLRSVRGVEVGNIFKLGTHFSESMGCYYLDHQGQSHPIIMGSYGIGVGRLLACIAEEHHDEHGLIWPISVSPYKIHLIVLPWKTGENGGEGPGKAEKLYDEFTDEHLDCLYDDREESPGIKFNDADLIGNPIRLTVSERSLKNGGVEYKQRDKSEKMIIPYENIIPAMQEEIKKLESKV